MLKLASLLFLLLTVADMAMKQYIEENFEEGEERETKVPKVVLRKVYNKGFAFHLLDRYPWMIRGSSLILSIIIAVYNIVLWMQKGRWLEKIGMIFLSAGAFSNTYDRLIRRKVIDYIGFKSTWKKVRTITPNLADFYIAIGAVLMTMARMWKK